MEQIDRTQQLGRVYIEDKRDLKFLMKPPPLQAILPVRKYWTIGPILDQGQTSQCVAYSAEQLLRSGPVKNLYYKTPAELYAECQLTDEWPGEDYNGTSVRSAMQILRAAGYFSAYNWAFDAETVVRYVLSTGPVILGTNWYFDMFNPDSTGFVTPTGSLAGGHAYMVHGVSRAKVCPDGTTGAVLCTNSWSRYWGLDGKFWMSFLTLARLLAEQGEAVTATEINRV